MNRCNMTTEVVQTFDLLPGIDQQAYAELVKRTVGALQRLPGLVEIRANRNALGSPQVRGTTGWGSLAAWAAAAEHAELAALEAESRRYLTNVRMEIWRPSPLMAEPVRAAG